MILKLQNSEGVQLDLTRMRPCVLNVLKKEPRRGSIGIAPGGLSTGGGNPGYFGFTRSQPRSVEVAILPSDGTPMQVRRSFVFEVSLPEHPGSEPRRGSISIAPDEIRGNLTDPDQPRSG